MVFAWDERAFESYNGFNNNVRLVAELGSERTTIQFGPLATAKTVIARAQPEAISN